MKTVIVILNWNGWEDTVRLVSSLKEHAVPAPVWVVDNGSTEDESQRILEVDPSAKVVRLDRNYGFAGGFNQAVRLAQDAGFHRVYAINNDCLVTNDFLTPCVDAAVASPGLAIVGSRYLSRDSNLQYTRWGFHSNPSERPEFTDGILVCDNVVGCGMLINCAAFSQAGGFDERFFCYGEENDLCWRLLKKGFQVGFCYESLILHNHKGSDVSGNAAYYRSRNSQLLRRMHPDHLGYMRSVMDALKGAWTSLGKSDFETAASYIQGLHHGLVGKYGKRGRPYSTIKAIALLLGYSVALAVPLACWRLLRRKTGGCMASKRSSP